MSWRFALGHDPGPWIAVLVVGAAALAAFEAGLAHRRMRGRLAGSTRHLLLGLRGLAILALLALAFELSAMVPALADEKRRLVILLDDSASMDLADAPARGAPAHTRIERLRALWAEAEDTRQAWHDAGLTPELRAFAADVGDAERARRVLDGERPEGDASGLTRALAELRAEADPAVAALAGVMVLTDGLVASDDAEREALLASARELGVPVTTVCAGAPEIVDVAIEEVRVGEFAFVENVAEFGATIVAHGLLGTRAEVTLFRDTEVVGRDTVMLGSDGVPRSIRFEVAPDRVGQFVYRIAVTPIAGEATFDNNERAVVVRVLRDKIRVLHVAGRPDWDVRALRTLLRRDPNVELLSYYIMRDPDDVEPISTSLIPFPTRELFVDELGSFDLVVLHNFDALRHDVAQYRRNLAEYVLEGGALVVIGGDLGLGGDDFVGGPLAEVLPIQAEGRGLVRTPVVPRITAEGARHPVVAWAAGREGAWNALPALDDYNPLTTRPSSDGSLALALLVHPEDRDGSGQPRPILAVGEPGKGRVVVLATGSSWRLGFAPELPFIDGVRPYDGLWLAMLRWLLRDESTRRLSVVTDRPRYPPTHPIEIQVTTLGPSYAAEPDVVVGWELRSIGDERIATHGELTTDGLGRAVTRLDGMSAGAWEIRARRQVADDQAQHEARAVFLVEPPTRELARVDADPGTVLCSELARATTGAALLAVDGDELPADPPTRAPVATRGGFGERAIPLWSGWPALLILLVAYPAEWYLRRHHGGR